MELLKAIWKFFATLGGRRRQGNKAERRTCFCFVGSAVSFISRGQKRLLYATDGYTVTSASDHDGQALTFSVRHADRTSREYWRVMFAAPKEQKLAPGEYEHAVRYPFMESGQPGLSFSGCGRGNNTLTGKFTVLECVVRRDGRVVSFAADFEQYDGGRGVKWTKGSVRYNSVHPANKKWLEEGRPA